jgi:prepilin-type N-terminal cleavage/methylation domain-containing protein
MKSRLLPLPSLDPRRLRRGFTLIEMSIATACAAIILVGAVTAYTYMMKGFAQMSNFAQTHKEAAKTAALFDKDVREVSSVGSFTSTYLKIIIPTNFTAVGAVSGTKTVTYSYTSNALYRTDSTSGQQKAVATNVVGLTFAAWDKTNSSTTNLATAKSLQLDMNLVGYVGSLVNSEEFRTAQIDMRNTP